MMKKGSDAAVGYINALVLSSIYDNGLPPYAPYNLAVRKGNNANILSWNTNAYNTAKGFEIYRKGPGDTSFVLLNPNPTNGSDTSFSDTNIHGNSTYAYTIRAVNQHGYSAFADTVSITTAAINPSITGIPSQIIIPYGTSDTIYFSGTADNIDSIHFTGINIPDFITITDSGNNKGSVVIHPQTQSDIGTYSLSILASTNHGGVDTSTYTIKVKDQYITTILVNLTDPNHVQGSPWNNLSGYGFISSISNLIDNTGTPTGLTLNNLDKWTSAFTTGETTFLDNGMFPDQVMAAGYYIADTSTKHIQLTHLDPTMKYNFTFFNSNYFNYITNYTTLFNINGKTDSLNGYRNFDKTVHINGISPDQNNTITININKSVLAKNGILNAMIIQAYNGSNNFVVHPTNLQANINLNNYKQIVLKWIDQSWNENGFIVWRATSQNGPYTQIATLPANTQSYIDSLVAGDVKYFYKVQAFNSLDTSDYSNVASVTTPLYAIYFNFNAREAGAGSPWNNTNRFPNNGDVYNNLLDASGLNTYVSISFPQNFESENTVGYVTGNNSGVFPDNVISGEYYLDNGLDTVVMVISNLDITMKYDLTFFGSLSGFSLNTYTMFIVNNQQATLDVVYNTDRVAQIKGISPDQDGKITVKIINAYGTDYAILGAMVIQAYDDYDNNGQLKATQPGSPYMYLKLGNTILNTSQTQAIAYPNPFHNTLHVGIPVEKTGETYQLRLLGINGQVIYEQPLGVLPQGLNDIRINLSHKQLTDGMYLLNIQSQSRQHDQTLKLIRR